MENTTTETNPPLLDVFSNNVAGIKAFNQCISIGKVSNDNTNRLICIDIDRHLKVFKDEILETETQLNVTPVGVVSYFSTDKKTFEKSCNLAVAGGINIYIYKNLKGTVKIPMPDHPPNSVEEYIYSLLENGEIKSKTCLEMLDKLANILFQIKPEDLTENHFKSIVNDTENEKIFAHKDEALSKMTRELFSLKSEKLKLEFLENNCNKQIKIYNYITLISSIPITEDFTGSPDSYLIIGTENSSLVIIDPSENKVINKRRLPGIPFLINCYGEYDGDHKIIIGDRGCNIYIIKKNSIINTIIIPQPLVGLLCNKKSIYIGTTGRNYISLQMNGDRNFSITENATITCMELANKSDEELVLIATKNNQLRIYKEKNLCYVLKIGDNIFGMKFGTFNNVNECVIMFTYGGALLVKSFNPNVRLSSLKFNENTNAEKGKLDIPKKTSLYLDLVEREKESQAEMHKKFQIDLFRIKYKAMNTYVKMLKIGNAPQNYTTTSNMKVSATLEGLGPNFKLNLIFSNVGKEPIFGAILTLEFNRKIFSFEKENVQLSIIMPNIPINYSLPFRNISQNGSSGNIKVIVVDKDKSIPLIQTNIKVPVSELDIL